MKKKNRRKSVKFKPSHDFLDQAVSDYLAKGGTITKLEFDEKAFRDFVSTGDSIAVDTFLMGN